MSFDLALEELQFDTVTIEPFSAFDASQAPTYGSAVTYTAQVIPATERIINAQGREVTSSAAVIIQGRVAVDHRSRITLPSGFSPNQPPIQRVEPLAGLGLDHTRIWL